MTQTSRFFLLGLLSLTACGAPGTGPAGTDSSTDVSLPRLQGHVENWPGGAATLQLRDGTAVLAQGSIDVGGGLALTLPAASTMDASLRVVGTPSAVAGCASSVRVTDPAARWRTFEGFAVYQNGTIVGGIGRAYGLTNLTEAEPGDYQVRWTYADRPLDVTGVLTCTSFKETYDLHLRAGWNASVLGHDTSYSSSGGFYELTWKSGSDATARWGFVPRGQ
ncbi:hypothetical protein DAETH_25630 [Deinococcus aetherius]|uniref:Lipoprotein n=1 Tax=Deinococcus aetherius TaxID=200252 RepID=A0ABM8AFL6_9DEIO|nr:hypothetical protein [Deinococcus aetherius]BDP42594.1 hypothetical protein DAETH_25630 [Deinococcus aetherius]